MTDYYGAENFYVPDELISLNQISTKGPFEFSFGLVDRQMRVADMTGLLLVGCAHRR